MNLHGFLRTTTQTLLQRAEETLDTFFEGRSNPLRHLGATGLYLLWIVVGTGLYLYTVLDTGISGVYDSIGYQSQQLWYFGGIVRSLHRYASDGFVLVMMLHLVREWAFGRYFGFRFYSWLTGIPLIWLVLRVWHQRLLDRLGPTRPVLGDRNDRTAGLAADFQRTGGTKLSRTGLDQ